MSARVERYGKATQFCVCFRLRHAVFWTQFWNAAHAGGAAPVSVIHTFECVSASWEVGQGSTVLRLLSPVPRHVPDTVY